MKLYTALLALILLAGLAYPAMACISDASDIILGPTNGVDGLLMIVITLTILLIAGAYMIGSVGGNANLIVFAKDEIYHLGFSIVILLGMSGIMFGACSFMNMYDDAIFANLGTLSAGCYTTGAGMLDVATCYSGMALSDSQSISTIYIQQYINYLMDSTFSWSLQFPLVNSYTSTAGAYKRIISNQYDMILNSFLVPAMLSISMQKLALQFISDNVVTWILPTAFLLRVFIPTRQMGNMLIALVLAMYTLVPFLFAFNFAMYDPC